MVDPRPPGAVGRLRAGAPRWGHAAGLRPTVAQGDWVISLFETQLAGVAVAEHRSSDVYPRKGSSRRKVARVVMIGPAEDRVRHHDPPDVMARHQVAPGR